MFHFTEKSALFINCFTSKALFFKEYFANAII